MICNKDTCDIRPAPCPRCGGEAKLKTNAMTAWIRCIQCGLCVIGVDNADVIRKWNDGKAYLDIRLTDGEHRVCVTLCPKCRTIPVFVAFDDEAVIRCPNCGLKVVENASCIESSWNKQKND